MISAHRRSHVIITGGRGYIGRAVAEAAIASGRRVTVLSRDARGVPVGARHVAWELGDGLPLEAIDPHLPLDAQVLVHLAHDWHDKSADSSSNFNCTRILRDSCRQVRLTRLVFASSQSARPDALNAYGRMKWRIEQLFDAPEEISIRIGLVYGGREIAQYGLLCRIVMKTSVVPLVAPHQLVQPIHLNEVGRGIILASDSDVAGTIGLAAPDPIPFSQFLDTLACRLRGGRMFTIPIPLGCALGLASFINALPFRPHVDRERILGLAGTQPIDIATDLARIGLNVAPLAEGLLDETRARRALLSEGRALLRYVLRAKPGGALVRRYARAVAAKNGRAGAMRLGRVVIYAPALLRLIEPFGGSSLLAFRLKIATTLAEASPEGARALARDGGRFKRLLALASDGSIELLATPLRLLATALQR